MHQHRRQTNAHREEWKRAENISVWGNNRAYKLGNFIASFLDQGKVMHELVDTLVILFNTFLQDLELYRGDYQIILQSSVA